MTAGSKRTNAPIRTHGSLPEAVAWYTQDFETPKNAATQATSRSARMPLSGPSRAGPRCSTVVLLLLALLHVEAWPLAQDPLIATSQKVHNVFPLRETEGLTVFFKRLDHHHWQAVNGAHIVQHL